MNKTKGCLIANFATVPRGAYRRIARDQVSPFFDDWPAVEEKLKVMLSGNELTPEQEALKTALENDD
ncbi:hypothetical protein [Escherichia coli]|uniref:hypothetical protein n=1 Tax=Escherichia coli TaxID=562 RepID=UPI0009C5A238|nr:hypothetical protein [Escherichia coli]MCX1604476.1 hypothetical protein [Escherichia coli]MCX1932952.1 hypothetical protein [Escherichia coli]NPK38962.1 hypothetical protein [Escherichia coli]OOJ23952.1 hypothetical protein BMT90_24185 [Escherichia coli]OOK08236.1 hypothetical protein BMT92_23940 [Escherichia coli]